jgi:hypothetical protein
MKLRTWFAAKLLLAPALLASGAFGQTAYFRHVFFDNGPRTGAYFYSSAKAVTPSVLEKRDDRLPVDAERFFTPPNSLKISWQSNPGGSWAAAIQVQEFRNREITFDGNTLSFWIYSPEAIPAAELPELRLQDVARNFAKEEAQCHHPRASLT